ncbi:hypothetical protein D3C84_410730 [compost metagenome]
MCGSCGTAQLLDLGLQLGRGVGRQLLLGLLQRDLGHAGFDLEFLQLVAETGRFACFCCAVASARRRFGLGGLGAGGFLGAGLALGFFLLLGAAQALLAQLEALLGLFGLELLVFQVANFALGRTVVLHQGNARRADIGAGAAFDAVEQVVRLELLVFLADGEEVQLLRQQAGRTDLGALAAADAGHGRRRWRQFGAGRGEQAVAGLDQRHVEVGQGETHHRPAHDQAVELAALETGKLQQFAHRGTQQRLDVHRSRQGFAGEGGDARDQRFAEHHRVVDGFAGADVLAEDADIRRQAAAGYFDAGEDLDQLLLAARGVFGREDPQLIAALAQGRAQCGYGFGLVVLDADQHLVRLDQLGEDVDAGDQLFGALAHQQIVGGDVGLALGAVDHQGMDLLGRPGVELDRRGEAGAAQAADPGLADHLQQVAVWQMAVVRAGCQLAPLIQAVAVDDDGRGEHAGDMRVRLRPDETDGA